MRNDKENLIVNLTYEFALDIIEFAEELKTARKFVIANQILKSGTSIVINVGEAQNAESKNDFIHKLKVAAKEADETEYFLLLCKFSKTYPFNEILIEKLQSIKRFFLKLSQAQRLNDFQIIKLPNHQINLC